eukprot:6642983-Alexandrium_andersonii.AAC.1
MACDRSASPQQGGPVLPLARPGTAVVGHCCPREVAWALLLGCNGQLCPREAALGGAQRGG